MVARAKKPSKTKRPAPKKKTAKPAGRKSTARKPKPKTKPAHPPATESHRQNDRWIKCISTEGNVRGVAIHATHMIREIAASHELRGSHSRALGEAVMGALLIASYCKAGEKINLNIQSRTGEVSQALVDAQPDGIARGYVIPRLQYKRAKPADEKGLEAGDWGDGTLSVLRTQHATSEKPYIGTVPLITGHLAKDLTFYWVQSEQIPSAVGLAVNIKDGEVTSAGGFLIQAMPGASEAELAAIERHIHEIQSLAQRLTEDADPMHLLGQIFQSTAFIVIEEKPIRFGCQCSMERVERALFLIGKEELLAILRTSGEAEVKCDFCAKVYKVDRHGLTKMLKVFEDREAEST
jgi:molecular chaperone Hsp33